MSRQWITGYRSYELGAFDEQSPKVQIIKRALREQMVNLIENGCDWIITGAQLGTEQWAVEIAADLKTTFPGQFQIAVMLPFAEFGSQWNENNQMRLQHVLALADFSTTVSRSEYHSPQQLKNYQRFMLTHTDGALLLYDSENEGKTHYDLGAIHQFQSDHPYVCQLIEFDDLQEVADQYEAERNAEFSE
ncbi:DUF1273 domain-containing protein [Fructilactobacillus myrtifloralis]|uniref:UPF0398 protein M3M35_01280 n=1 Tax=Fructilactobacillus myrtifloralis TaxID=2940301 RepID=A0ABY5BP37_9LACO|nr:DUF1273 domain-containing protein [Fructilactobacillus myrtifloralis]USS85325.1 DUF1273 domain-containing protein [Fructilactobacillus myrtifloralis]